MYLYDVKFTNVVVWIEVGNSCNKILELEDVDTMKSQVSTKAYTFLLSQYTCDCLGKDCTCEQMTLFAYECCKLA